MKPIKLYLFVFVCLFQVFTCFGQHRVGLVLSGGGATGFAHIGVLKALEEKGIPVDFITGTSSGALIGSLYSAGYSPEEIEAYVLSDDFLLMTKGKIKPSQHFLYKEEEENGSMVDFSFSADSIIYKSLPTSVITSAYLDFEMLKLLGTTGACYDNDFNQLFVPFRCVASDVTNKKSVVFDSGNLNEAVRASMTYPFYFSPLRVDGVLLFDGGLYNNFPADVMYKDFDPDFIIGSNVSYNAKPPTEDDLISQVTNMLVTHSDFNLPCEEGLILEPKSDISTFDFESVEKAILAGYETTIKNIDSICFYVDRRVTKEELTRRRQEFRSKVQDLKVTSITNNFYRKKNITYARASMINERKNEVLGNHKLERRYYRLYATPQIEFIYPTVQLKADSTYNLNLKVRKSKDFKLDVGGHFSSRPVNTGYVGLTYRLIGKTASSIHASSYFGKFYGSAKINYSIEIPSIFPISVSTYFVMNRWDYFRSFATFFEDVQPSFLVQNEMYYGAKLNHPIGNTTKSTFDFRLFDLVDEYYQTKEFTNKDTADITDFKGYSMSWEFVQNSLNRKQYANNGHYFRFKARYVNGHEKSTPGSTSIINSVIEHDHSWINLNADFQSFVINTPNFHFGIQGKGVFNSQSLFSNYTASLLAMSSFSLLPDAETFFLPEYRSPQHIGAGINAILTFKKNFDVRLDGFYYQPFVILQKNDNGTFGYSKPFKGETYMASASFIYNTYVGPLRATLNYFAKQSTPFFFQISFGYVLFNERAIR